MVRGGRYQSTYDDSPSSSTDRSSLGAEIFADTPICMFLCPVDDFGRAARVCRLWWYEMHGDGYLSLALTHRPHEGPWSHSRWSLWRAVLLRSILPVNPTVEYAFLSTSPSTEYDDVIQRDVHRTFVDANSIFREERGRDVLFRLLRSIANKNPELGYCQGMNFIAAGMWIVASSTTASGGGGREEECFAMTYALLSHSGPSSFSSTNLLMSFSHGFPGLNELFWTLDELIAIFLPLLTERVMAPFSIKPGFYATQWFLTVFSYDLSPFNTYAVWVWDAYIVGGWAPVLACALAVLDLAQGQLESYAAVGDMEGILTFLRVFLKTAPVDNVSLMKRSKKFSITHSMLENLNSIYNTRLALQQQQQPPHDGNIGTNGWLLSLVTGELTKK